LSFFFAEPPDLREDLLRHGDPAAGGIDVQENRLDGVGILVSFQLIQNRARFNQLTIDVDDLDPVRKREFRSLVPIERQHYGDQSYRQKHKGSSTKEEPYERSILHPIPQEN